MPPLPVSEDMEIDEPKNENILSDLHITPSASANESSKYPDMTLAVSIHWLFMSTGENPALETASDLSAAGIPSDLEENIQKKISKDMKNPSLYRQMMQQLGGMNLNWSALSEQDLSNLETEHTKTLDDLELKVDDAKESAGDMEVLDARFSVARFAAKCLSKDKALDAYDKVLELPKLSRGKKIDALMEQARVASFYGDTKRNSQLIQKAVNLASDGGDWDRRNRLKVYNALTQILARDIKAAASFLIDCIATFSCTELCSYKDFVVYTIMTNILHLPRTELKEKIIDGPEILAIKSEIPIVFKLVNALYDCDYKTYLTAMVEVQPILVADRFLQPHAGYIMRELHVLGYKQFLDSYKSVTLESMASSFGVGTQFLDVQLSRFIAAGRLTAKIDKYGGVVETNRPDLKNAQYRDMIQKGDLLLNRIQKLARVVDL